MIKVGIAFVTGRRDFKNLIRTFVNNWNEHGLVSDPQIHLHVYVVYDLKYAGARVRDFKKLCKDAYKMTASISIIGETVIKNEIALLVKQGVVTNKQARLIFGDGYAKRRNAAMYFALKSKMDCLLFLDDDEYPVACYQTNNNRVAWMGQSVVGTHLKYIFRSDMTHGRHCGYISPIPQVTYSSRFTEHHLRTYIRALSNDIVSWGSVKKIIQNNGVTYANRQVIWIPRTEETPEINNAKFISGSNLCLNFKKRGAEYPFYNPPLARGEDTFLSTCLRSIKVTKVPVYTFHDGFLKYRSLLHGVLPQYFKPAEFRSEIIKERFLKASIGWMRYKPLYTYIVEGKNYSYLMKVVRKKLVRVLPKVCEYFNSPNFMEVLYNFDHYTSLVENHFVDFEQTKLVWKKIIKFVRN